MNLKDIVYSVLTCEGRKLGIMQLINKRRGLIIEKDLELARDAGELVGNYINVMMTNFRLMNTLEKVTEGFNIATQGLEIDIN